MEQRMKKKIVLRKAAFSDLADLAEISRTTWDGDDYLEKVSEKWIKQHDFFVGEIDDRVIACGKISTLPGEVAWLEGLRVHKDFKGRGYGRILSGEILQIAVNKLKEGHFKAIEFSTYVNNTESISTAEKQGFSTTEFFHVISMENPPMVHTPVALKRFIPEAEDFSVYSAHAPCGWKYIEHRSEDSLDWMKQNAEFWQMNTGARFLSANRGSEISPLSSAIDDPEGFIQGVFAFAEKKRLDYLEIMIHDSHKEIIEHAMKSGFSYWENPGVANLPVYRFFD